MDGSSKAVHAAGGARRDRPYGAIPVALAAIVVAVALSLLEAPPLSGLPAQPTAGVPATTAPPAAPTSAASLSPCWVTYTKGASPIVMLLGETVSGTLVARHLCPAEVVPMHVVLVLDGSASMAGEPRQRMRAAALDTLRYLALEEFPWRHVGVVAFGGGTARELCRLGSREAQLRTCVPSVGAEGSASAAPGLRAAARILGQADSDPDCRPIEVIVLFSAGALDDCQEAASAARTAKNRGAEIAAVCVGADCASSCLRDVASAGRFLTDRPLGPLFRFLEEAGTRIEEVRAAELVLRDELGPDVVFVPSSASPPPSEPRCLPDARRR